MKNNKHNTDSEKDLPSSFYFDQYVNLQRFISYYYQIDSVMKTNAKSVLEIGIGNRMIADYLDKSGFNVVTCDFNEKLNPDKVGDIRNLPFEDNTFDAVLAFEILEHIPFEDVEVALSELKRVSKKNVIISIPYPGFHFEIIINANIPFLNKMLRLIAKVPFFIHEHKKGEHYWEMGRKNNSKRTVKELLKMHFDIKDEFQVILNPQHYFFILEIK
jgi:ubiquinone/menaquinone biosynthesis C-methylase UbiE